jgi:hypothetical protein
LLWLPAAVYQNVRVLSMGVTRTYRADLHVHSQFSNRFSMWALRRFNCPESFAAPLAVYELAKRRGMD